ncbi:MAG: helix-turn-helix domain-containing protein [Nitrospirales bacterium]
MLTDALRKAARTATFTINGDQLREWRLSQAGTYIHRRRRVNGWSQARAAEWFGAKERTWRAWEKGELPVPVPVVKAIVRYSESIGATIDRALTS